MTQKEFLVKHGELLDKLRDITARKNADYSQEEDALNNFKMVEQLHITSTSTGMLVRITDKFARTINLLKKEAKVKDESILDTLLDFANYCLILAVYKQSGE